ncbi:MAG: hypothetical protein R3A52_18145 [Polyangiales bacterium]
MRRADDDIVRCANGHRPAALFRHLPRARESCQRHLLYGNALGRMELCTGGTLSLVVGGLTLRLPVDALLTLHDLVHGALTALDEAERRASQRPLIEEN